MLLLRRASLFVVSRSILMLVPAVALSGCALLFGPKDNPSRSEAIEVSTAEGCKLQRIAYVIRDEDYDFQKKMNADARARQANGKYWWSGKCEDGYISGPGELTQELDYGTSGKVKSTEFFVAKPGKPRKYYAYLQKDDAGKVSVTGGYRWQYMGTLGKHDRYDNIISDVECADTRDCRALRDTLLAMLDADQRAKVAADSDRGAQADKQRVQDEIKRDEIAQRESEAEMRKIEDENRAQKRRWLAENAQTDGGGASGTLAVLGAVMQGAAAGGGKNAAQMAALGGAMQGNSRPLNSSVPADSAPGSNSQLNPTVPAVNRCIKLGRPSKYEVSFVNSCDFPVQVTYCFVDVMTGKNPVMDLRDAACDRVTRYRTSGTPEIPPGEANRQHAPYNGAPINFIACPSGEIRAERNIRWEGGQLRGSCGGVIGERASSNGPAVRSGAIR